MNKTALRIPPKVKAFVESHPEWADRVDLLVFPPSADEAATDFPELHGDRLLADSGEMTHYGVTRLALYYRQRDAGIPHKLALMVACQSGPALKTDATFFARPKTLAQQFTSPGQLAKVIAIARKHGYNPGAFDTYVPDIASFQGDPVAFVPPSGGRTHMRRVLEQKGWQGTVGDVTTPYIEPTSDPHETTVKIAPDLVNRLAKKMVAEQPELKRKSRAELREMVLEKHGPTP